VAAAPDESVALLMEGVLKDAGIPSLIAHWLGGPRVEAGGTGEAPRHGTLQHRGRLTSSTPTGANNKP
jgi:hypothetical protein